MNNIKITHVVLIYVLHKYLHVNIEGAIKNVLSENQRLQSYMKSKFR